MPRTPDETIPVDEALYRSVSIDDVFGDEVLPQAVDLPRCSFNRSAYSNPDGVLTPKRPRDNGVVAVTTRELPDPVPRETAAPYVFFVADDPNPSEEPENDAHCEVRMRPMNREFSKNHKVNKEVLAKAKEALARKLRIVLAPR
jgi:hypothetical protein